MLRCVPTRSTNTQCGGMQCFHIPTRGLPVSQRNLAVLCRCSCTLLALQIPPVLEPTPTTPLCKHSAHARSKNTFFQCVFLFKISGENTHPKGCFLPQRPESRQKSIVKRRFAAPPPIPMISTATTSSSPLPLAHRLPRNVFYSQLAFPFTLFLSDAL